MAITLNEQNFEEEVLKSDLPVLVDFWATWCGPCKMMAPIVDRLAGEMEGKIKVGKVDVDENPGLAAAFGITSIPTVIVFKDGKPEKTSIGLCSLEELKQLLNL